MLIGIFYSQIVERSFLVSVLFREAISHPYISFIHLLVNGFSFIIIIIIIINFFRWVFSEYTEAVITSLTVFPQLERARSFSFKLVAGRRCFRGRGLMHSKEAMDNFFAQSHYTDSPQTKLFYSAHCVRFIY